MPDPGTSSGAGTSAGTVGGAGGWTGRGDAVPTRLLLLRHGQSPLSVQRRYSGRGDPELTEVGEAQARAAATALAARYAGELHAVISSPLSRARRTADALASRLGRDVVIDERFTETDFGEWEGLTFGEAAARDPALHRSWLSDSAVAPPAGESFDVVTDRVRGGLDAVLAAHAGRTVALVSHVTPIKTVLRLALAAGPQVLYRLHLDLACLSVVEFWPDGGASVRLVNETSYLAAPS